jgi:N-acyl-D-aspartate/D-glutamate deacylase
MTADLLITGARISDGTGLPAFTGDVEVRDGRIARVGNLRGVAADKVIDACGLDLVPGFVDIHTHYDAQLYFEPTASPSSWHGVTTVITGNCGFAIAPSKPEDVEWLVLMLAKVEGMSADALFAGVPFRGGSWGDFVDPYAGRIGVNVASYVGHSAVRRWVMGAAASEREATSDEIRAMQAVVDTAMRQGALGFSTSQLDVHADHEGRPVPSNLAAPEELVALSAVLADYDQGVLQNLCRTFAIGYDQSDRALLADMVRASGNKPMHANMLQRFTNDPDIWRTCLGILEGYAREGLRIYPMASANPKGLHLSLADTGMLDEMPIFREVLVLPKDERVRRLQDHATRDRMRDEFANAPRQLAFDWTQLLVASTRDAANTAWTGRSVAELALERNADPLDTFIDLSLLEDLETVFAIDRPVTKEDREVIRYLLAHPLAMPGSSDGGAHVNTFCGADYTTRVLTEYVDDEFTFELAVRKLSALPAASLGLWDRGEIRPGNAADMVLIDRTRLAVGPARLVRDFPAGAGRMIWEQRGYESTIVNGQVIVEDSKPTGATPGVLVRFNQ